MFFQTEDAVVVCKHEQGVARIKPSQDWLTVEGRRVLVDSDPEQRPIVGCPNIAIGIKPCTQTLKVRRGYSKWLKVDGRRVALDAVRGLTDGTPPGLVEYKVRRAGQELVAEKS